MPPGALAEETGVHLLCALSQTTSCTCHLNKHSVHTCCLLCNRDERVMTYSVLACVYEISLER